jgi:hypothetical protein
VNSGQHSSKSPEHGTPARIVQFARDVIGRPDLDPASSAKWNRVVGAERFFDKRTNGTATPWVPGAPAPLAALNRFRAHAVADIESIARDAELEGRHEEARRILAQVALAGAVSVFLNPPGDRKGVLVAAFWASLSAYFALGYVRSAIWVGFSLEQLARLQRVGAASHPLEHLTLVPSHRLRYSAKLGKSGDAPTHGSFLTLLTRSRTEAQRFRVLGRELGHVIGGVA